MSNMNIELWEQMSPADQKSYFEFFLHHYRVMDGFWFIYVTEQFGQAAAEKINERVWGKVAAMAAKEIVRRFNITGTGLGAFVKAYRLFPWSLIIHYQIEEKPDEVLISVAHCPPQEARLKRGLGEYVLQTHARRGVHQLRPGRGRAHPRGMPLCPARRPPGGTVLPMALHARRCSLRCRLKAVNLRSASRLPAFTLK